MIKAGIVGAGFWADAAHLPGLKNAGAEIVGVYSRSEERAQQLAGKYGAVVFSDFDKLCRSVDIVAVATPNNTHVDYALQAVDHGCHLFLDKPVAHHYSAAEELETRLHGKNIKVVVTFSSRGHPAVIHAKKMIENGAVGEVLYLRGYFHTNFMADPSHPFIWRGDREIAGPGALGDLGSHMFDLVRFCTGLEFERVGCLAATIFRDRPGGRVDNDDTAAVSAELTGGIQAQFSLSRVHSFGPQVMELEIQGTNGALKLQPSLSVNPHNYLLEYTKRDGTYAPVAIPEYHFHGSGIPFDWDMHFGEFLFTELAYRLIRAIETNSTPSPSLDDGMKAQAVIDAADRSAAESGGIVKIPSLSQSF